jgi:hypothetical protein
MSAYSTINITRSAAKRALINKLMSDATDDELEKLLDEMILERRLRRCRIVSDDDENEDDILT